jgi:hypothetical protein
MLPYGMTFKNTVKVHNLFHDLLNKVSDIIVKIPNYKDLKGDPEILLLICNLVENMMTKNSSKIDKKDLAICVYENIFGELTDEEKISLDTNIQFLYNNNKIKKQKLFKIVGYYVFDYIKRRLL